MKAVIVLQKMIHIKTCMFALAGGREQKNNATNPPDRGTYITGAIC